MRYRLHQRVRVPDLDLRPPAMERFTIGDWVQECPHCGYCAAEIEEVIAGAAEMVESAEYLTVLKRPATRGGRLIRRFLCASILYERAGDLAGAARMALYAAWAADDANERKREAQRVRKRVLLLVDQLHAGGGHLDDDPESDTIRMVDVARRAGDFRRAARLIGELAGTGRSLFQALAAFQQGRVEAMDTKAYTIQEAMPDPAG